MRITYIGFGDFHVYAGMKQLYHFAQEVCRQGHQAQILIAGSAETVQAMEEPPLAEIVEMAFVGPRLTRRVRQRVLDFEPDILHVWTPRHVPALAGWQLQRCTGAKLILDHEDDEDYLARLYSQGQGKRLRGALRPVARPLAQMRGQILPWLVPLRSDGRVRRMARDRLAAALLRPCVDAHTAISPALVAHVRRAWATDSVYLLYPGADLALFAPQRNGGRVRQQYALEGRRLLVYTGTMNLAIFEYFVRVMQHLVIVVPDAFLLLVGNDGFRSDAQSLVAQLGLQDHVRLIGIVPYPEVAEHLAAADVLLQHPLDIGNELRLPAKIPEYLAMGKPIVTYSQGIGEILEDGVHALKVSSLKPDEMAQCLLMLLSDPSLRMEMARAARSLALHLFDWQANTRKLLSIYQAVVGAA